MGFGKDDLQEQVKLVNSLLPLNYWGNQRLSFSEVWTIKSGI